MDIVGLPTRRCRKAAAGGSRAQNAGLMLRASAWWLTWRRASVRKEGPAYDLPIALGVSPHRRPGNRAGDGTLVIGELSLDGIVRHTRGVLPMAALARSQGFRRIVIPQIDAAEAALVPDWK